MIFVRRIRYGKSKTPSFSPEDNSEWYQSAHRFWQNASSDESGVMMGRADLHPLDITSSNSFFEHVCSKKKDFVKGSVLDCGAGIGRVSSHLLQNHFQEIDMLEKCSSLLNEARNRCTEKVYRHFYCSGLQNFTFSQKYDAIWIQWVLTHLQDQEIKDFLLKAKANLNKGGVIIVKQNYSTHQRLVDSEDCTIIRTPYEWKSLFYSSNFLIFSEQNQRNWPKDLYPVNMWALI